MTCIVGFKDVGHVVIGGDSAGTDSHGCTRALLDKKVFRVGDFVIGYTTSYRMAQLLEHCLDLPTMEASSVLSYMVKTFVPAVKTAFREGGWLENKDGIDFGGEFLVGYKNHLFQVCGNFAVHEFADGFAAVGSGYTYALGSLSAARQLEGQLAFRLSAETRVVMALTAATEFDGGVRGPFTCLSTGE